MLPAYGVVVGRYLNYTKNQGQWLHVDLNIETERGVYQAAVDVNEPSGIFQYQVLNGLDATLFTTVSGLPSGWHALASNPTSGALDYVRSPILQRPLGCAAIFWVIWNNLFGTSGHVWTAVTGDEAGEALVALLAGSVKIYAFGAPYVQGLGVHDVHYNQGDPPGSHQASDGIWQDGGVVVERADGSLSAYLGKFSTQSLKTDAHGLPA